MSRTPEAPDTGRSTPPVSLDAGQREAEIRRLMDRHGVCRRTARRYLARGTEPSTDRTFGRDLKWYPAHPAGSSWTPLLRPLRIARSHVRRAKRIADEFGHLYEADIKLLCEIFAETADVLQRFDVEPLLRQLDTGGTRSVEPNLSDADPHGREVSA